jgi:hypothetical protein
MKIPRVISGEVLDSLLENDPAAIHSRRDLRRIHLVMGTKSHIVFALRKFLPIPPFRILEIGAGDGSLMLGVAQKLAPSWSKVEITLLDKQILTSNKTIANYIKLGWSVKVSTMDVLAWAETAICSGYFDQENKRYDIIVANLFMHHFNGTQLAKILSAIAAQTDQFLAIEPRRSWFSLLASHLVGVIGANKVTRKDAVLSVHAGFCCNEISLLWRVSAAQTANWKLQEYSSGLFSHCFYANNPGVT